jgi:2-dehydro-3-deoxyphosphogluconate aldolase/(4S)-4-hydroxy-2-oxoglutarate aldolase
MEKNRKELALDIVLQQGLLPLYFNADAAVSTGVLQSLYRAGVRAVEYTNRGPEALQNFRKLIEVRNDEMPGMLLGIGTIKTAAQAADYVDAGADFLISPGTIPEVAEAANAAGMLWVPGCMTTTEIIVAEGLGCSFIKLFPGNLLGPAYVSAIRDIFPALKFMPTGGVEVEEDNIRAWFKSGVSAVGMGSKLISKDLMQARDYAAIESLTLKALQLVKLAR